MNLFNGKDYRVLDQKYQKEYELHESKWTGKLPIQSTPANRDARKEVRHYLSLFPNNFLDTKELYDYDRHRKLIDTYKSILDGPSCKERDLQSFIRDQEAYFIIGSILKRHYSFGHHEAVLFSEFHLGIDYVADYLLVGRGSGGWQFVFIEMESPQRSTRKDGSFNYSTDKGVNQTIDWLRWLENSFSHLSNTFEKKKHPKKELPKEFRCYESYRMHFIVVSGRRENFNKISYRERREKQRNDNRLILHYDNLLDYAESLLNFDRKRFGPSY